MPQISSPSPRFAIYTLVGSAIGAALFSAHLWAAATPPLPNIAIDVKQTQTKLETTNSADQQQGNGGGMGGGNNRMGGGQNITTKNNEIYYIITLSNNSNFPASNVELDYTIYNTTSTTSSKGTTSSNTDQITGSETVDIPANSSKDIETTKVPHQQQQAGNTSSGSGGRRAGGGGGGGNQAAKSTTVQRIAGIWAQVKIGDNVIKTYEEPMDIKKKMEAHAKGGGASSSLDDLSSF